MKSKLLNHQKMMISRPLENIPVFYVGTSPANEFFEEKNCGNKIREIPFIVEKSYLAGGEFNTKSYVGNTPPKSSFFDDGPSRYLLVGQGQYSAHKFSLFETLITPSYRPPPVNSDITIVFPAPELVYTDIYMVGVPCSFAKLCGATAPSSCQKKKHECPYEHPQFAQDNAVRTARTPSPRIAPSQKYPGER